jgi:hypothetical protein
MNNILARMANELHESSFSKKTSESLKSSRKNSSMSDIEFKRAMEENRVAPYVMKFSNWKWLVLLLGSLMTLGDWYCFDRPAVMEYIMFDEF